MDELAKADQKEQLRLLAWIVTRSGKLGLLGCPGLQGAVLFRISSQLLDASSQQPCFVSPLSWTCALPVPNCSLRPEDHFTSENNSLLAEITGLSGPTICCLASAWTPAVMGAAEQIEFLLVHVNAFHFSEDSLLVLSTLDQNSIL